MKTHAMRWPLWVSLLGLLCLAAGAALGKDDVIRMAREGKGEQAILDAIREAHAAFDLTANDIADLRSAGVSQAVIDAMLETVPAQAAADGQPSAEEPYAPQGEAQGEVEPQPDEPYYEPVPAPVPVAYPIYPLYYPVYYPVYDPFFPFFGGFFFSFGFVHVSHVVTIFPCSRSVVVVNNRTLLPRGTLLGTRSTLFSTPRILPRGSSTLASRPARVRLDGAARPGVMGGARAPGALHAGPRPAERAPQFRAPRGQSSPRFQGGSSAPGVPRFRAPGPAGPWAGGPRGMPAPRSMAGPRSMQAPRFGGFSPGPRSGFAPAGGFRGSGSPRAGGGGGHGHGGHH